jgi:DNA-directed RNA polymerase specialized sigma54-like protein
MRMLLNIRPAAGTKIKPINSIRIASILEMQGADFVALIREVEADPIFLKLLCISDKSCRVIMRRRFPNSGFALNFGELKQELTTGDPLTGLSGLISSHKEAVKLICELGRDKFEKYFLFNEECCPLAEILRECRISEEEATLMNRLVEDLSVLGEFSSYRPDNSEKFISFSKIASIEKDGPGAFVVKFTSQKYACGRYAVDLVNLNSLKESGYFNKAEARGLKNVLDKIDMINSRKSIMNMILQKIIEKQAGYFNSGDEKDLVPFTQVELARETGLDESVVSRGIYAKTIETPDSVERPLKYFLPNNKYRRGRLIKEILQKAKLRLTDIEIKNILEKEYGINIARRTVNAARNSI